LAGWLFEITAGLLARHSAAHALEWSLLRDAIAESAMAAVSAILFKQGRWKKQKI
jgi:hypothetical protein